MTSTKPNIYIDLDNTLVFAAYNAYEFDGKSPQTFNLGTGERYFFVVREGSIQLLQELRKLAKVRLLTVSAKEYAQTINKLANLGFDSLDIIAREDWLEKVGGWNYGSPEYRPVRKNSDPCSILIDDKSLDPAADNSADNWLERKMTLLGITHEHYVCADFFDNEDWKPLDIERILKEINNIQNKTI